MGKYQPLTISYANSGLEKDKAGFVLADDAFQNLENAFVWRGRIRRRSGFDKLGRLTRQFSGSYFDTQASTWNITSIFSTTGYIIDIDISGSPTLVVTTSMAHGLTNGDSVVISGVTGTTDVNGNTYTVANVTATTFEVTQASASAYVSGGFYYSDRAFGASEPDKNIECGSVVIVLDVGGTPETFTDQGDGTLTSNLAGTGTINYFTGAVSLTHSSSTSTATTLAYNYYPCLPVMGLPTRELDAINSEQSIAFDTVYSYVYDSSSEAYIDIAATNPKTWSGNDSQFFASLNYWRDANNNKYFWTTNFNQSDPIRVYNGTEWSGTGGTLAEFEPWLADSGTATNPKLYQAKIIISYKGRLVALNTYEGDASQGRGASIQYPQRARWSQNGDPTDLTNGWRSDIAGRGGYVDCPISEHIVGAEFIRDQLVVTFERSTWILRYTGNEVLPFVWDRINRERGADSQFSMVPFDKGVIYIGDKSINSCDGNNVDRIDQKIPEFVFSIQNGNSGNKRVHGERNFFEKLVYWTYRASSTGTAADTPGTYPNRMLIFNYENGGWAIFKDSFTVLGQWQSFDDRTWASLAGTQWSENNRPWNDPRNQSGFPNIIGGNQQGYVLLLDQKVNNDASLFIKDVTLGASTSIECPNHNLEDGDWIKITGAVGAANFPTAINDALYQVSITDSDNFVLLTKPRTSITAITQATQAVVTAAGHQFQVGNWVGFLDVAGMTEINGIWAKVTAVSANSFTIDLDTTTFTAYTSGGVAVNPQLDALPYDTSGISSPSGYFGCGEITTVQNFRIRSKKFNLIQQGRKNFLGQIDFLVQVTVNGEMSCNIFTDYADSGDTRFSNNLFDSAVNQSTGDTFFNNRILTQRGQFSQEGKIREWKRLYCPVDAQFFEFVLGLSDDQMATEAVVDSSVWIDAFIVWTERGGRLAE